MNFADHLCKLLGVGNVPSWLFRLQNQAKTIKGGARAAAAAAAAAARHLQRLDREAGFSATATAAAEAATAAAAAAAGAAVSLGRLMKQAHQVRDRRKPSTRLRAPCPPSGAHEGAPKGPPADGKSGGPACLSLSQNKQEGNQGGPLAPAGNSSSRGVPWSLFFSSTPCSLLRPLGLGKKPWGAPQCSCCNGGPWWSTRQCRRPEECLGAPVEPPERPPKAALTGGTPKGPLEEPQGPLKPRHFLWLGRRQASALMRFILSGLSN